MSHEFLLHLHRRSSLVQPRTVNVFPIEVPPLRERKDDILMLVEYFVKRYASRAGKNIRSIDRKTVNLLHYYDWPGNIRELQNVIERSVILCSSEVFSVDESWLSNGPRGTTSRVQTPAPLKAEAEPRSEREIIEAALAESRGRVSGPSGAAARLGIPPSSLDHWIKALKIDKSGFKVPLKPAPITRNTIFTRITRFPTNPLHFDGM